MIPEQIEQLCAAKEQELLDKYFGNAIYEAAIVRPETIGAYTKDLPLKIEAEYFEFLKRLWDDVRGDDSRSLDDLLDKRHLRMLMTEDDREGIEQAYDNAVQITLWERLTKSNHKDVTFYKGLLKEYACELLRGLTVDFLEDVCKD